MSQELVPAPRVFERAGTVFTSSLDVAEFFGKQHRDVLRAIDNLECPEDFTMRNFAQGSYTLPNTGAQEHRYFDMTKDGFTFLVMGFTGKKAAEFKIRYIEAFNKMEGALRGPARPAATLPDLSDPSVLLPLLIAQTKANEAARAQLAAAKPAVDFVEGYVKPGKSMTTREVAQCLNIPERAFFEALSNDKVIYRGPGDVWLPHADQRKNGRFVVKTLVRPGGRPAVQMRWNGAGVVWASKRYAELVRVP